MLSESHEGDAAVEVRQCIHVSSEYNVADGSQSPPHTHAKLLRKQGS